AWSCSRPLFLRKACHWRAFWLSRENSSVRASGVLAGTSVPLRSKVDLIASVNSVPSKSKKIGIGAAVTRRPLPHHRAYGPVHGGSRRLRCTHRPKSEVRGI